MTASLEQKLQLKAHQNLLLINTPSSYREKLATMLDSISLKTAASTPQEGVLLFVSNLKQVMELAPSVSGGSG